MYDYSSMPTFNIENVDHEIHILGVKLSAMVGAIGVFVFTAPILGPLAILLSLAYCAIARQFFAAAERGSPIEYRPEFIRWAQKSYVLYDLFSLDKIVHSKGIYRG